MLRSADIAVGIGWVSKWLTVSSCMSWILQLLSKEIPWDGSELEKKLDRHIWNRWNAMSVPWACLSSSKVDCCCFEAMCIHSKPVSASISSPLSSSSAWLVSAGGSPWQKWSRSSIWFCISSTTRCHWFFFKIYKRISITAPRQCYMYLLGCWNPSRYCRCMLSSMDHEAFHLALCWNDELDPLLRCHQTDVCTSASSENQI